jgi:ferredoxin-like protein FixX
MHPMKLLGDVCRVEFYFGPFGNSVSVVQNRCMVCAKCTIASEIILAALDDTPR